VYTANLSTFSTLVALVFNTVLNADSSDKHDFDKAGYPWEAAPVGKVMVADKLPSAVLAAVILCAVAFFPFRDTLGLWQRGHVISMLISIIP
jgi:hypothetical protein